MDKISGAPITQTHWTATGLPQGLTINEETGYITGTPTKVEECIVTISVTTEWGTSTTTRFFKCVLSPNPIISSAKDTTAYPNDNINYTLTAYTIDTITGERLNNSITEYFLGELPEKGEPTINTSNGYVTYKIPSIKEINPPTEIILNIGCKNIYEKETILPYKINVLEPEEYFCTNPITTITAYPTDTVSYQLQTNHNTADCKILYNGYDPSLLVYSDEYIIDDINNNSYAFIRKKGTWYDSKNYCEQLGGHLLTFPTGEKCEKITNSFIDKGITQCGWIGGTDEGTEGNWRWITGEEWLYSNWSPGQPDNNEGTQHFLKYFWDNEKWDDCANDCANDSNNPFYCEWNNINLLKDKPELIKPSFFYNSLNLNNNNRSISWDIPTVENVEYGQYIFTFNCEDQYGQTFTHNLGINIEEPPYPIIEKEITDIAYMLSTYKTQIIAYTLLYDESKLTTGNTYYISNIPEGISGISINSSTGVITWDDITLNTPYPYITITVTVKNKYGMMTSEDINIPTCAPKSYLPVINDNYDTYSYYQYDEIKPMTITGLIIHGCKFYNGHTYKFMNITKSWYEAQSYCESLGGHLAYIKNEEQNNFVTNLCNGYGWIGIHDVIEEGTWMYANDELITYSNWAEGQPDNAYSGTEDFGHIYNSDGKWNDKRYNDSLLPFVCEWDSTTNKPYIFMDDDDDSLPDPYFENITINEPINISATVINNQINEVIVEEFTYF